MPSNSEPLTTAKAPRLHQAIANRLGIAILSGDYQPGEPLSGEIEQALALGVSRTPYREAIRILVSKGLLESRPKAGTHVTARSRWNLLDPDVLAWMFMGKPDPAFICDLFELRGLIEPAAASLAAERRSEAQLMQMEDALGAMRRHGLATLEGRAADQQFHHAILEAAGNLALASLSSSVGAAVQWTTHFKQHASKTPRDPLPEHEAVYQAIAAADPARAHAAMSELLRLALEDMAVALPDQAQSQMTLRLDQRAGYLNARTIDLVGLVDKDQDRGQRLGRSRIDQRPGMDAAQPAIADQADD
jgi:DNA-binding FadR family transcriptional regulator